jgi:hypothetical protein
VDYSEPIDTHLNLPAWAERFQGYPDQELASLVMEGMRYKSEDRVMAVVIFPHLHSLSKAFQAVEKSLLKLVDMGWYVLSSCLPIVPCYCPPQGAVPRAHGGWEDPRRIENDTAPHKELRVPGSGELIISTNVLSGIRERLVEVADSSGHPTADADAEEEASNPSTRVITFLTYGKTCGRRPKCDISLDASELPHFTTGDRRGRRCARS